MNQMFTLTFSRLSSITTGPMYVARMLAPITLLLFATTLHADQISWTAGNPPNVGLDQFLIVVDGTPINFGVSITTANDPKKKAQAVKAELQSDALKNRFPKLRDVTIDGDADKLTFSKNVESFKIVKGGLPTGEPLPKTSIGLVDTPAFGFIGFTNTPVGLTPDGSASIFEASLGFLFLGSTIFADSSLTYPELSSPTIAGVLTDTFNQLQANLPNSFRSNLHLDLAEEQIVFDFLLNASDAFVANSTSDLETQVFGGMSQAPVPEPSTLMLLTIGVISLIGLECLRRFYPHQTEKSHRARDRILV
jgi:PEP-CTERM motif